MTGNTVNATDVARWSNPGSLASEWEARAIEAAKRVPAGARVLDLGCGSMAIERHLPAACSYLPCDLVARDQRTIVCDFNASEIPDEAWTCDRILALGLLEYIVDLPTFIDRLALTGKPLIASYSPTDFIDGARRAELGWLNHYSTEQLRGIFGRKGLAIKSTEQIDATQVLFVLELAPARQPEQSVLVLSCAHCGNFGDRLGVQMIHSVLPPSAAVWHAYLDQMPEISGNIDLLVVGIGNSLYSPLLTDRLLEVVGRARRSIGIFGTQYRGGIDRSRMRGLVSRLDAWYARYEEDLLLYGTGRNAEVHFGDWLIDAFAMTEARDSTVLNIGDEIWNDLPLDRVIEKIQRHTVVSSTRLHPLLCALTSARQVAYIEQRETASGESSGKFDAMLLDVFGRRFAENRLWEVDRSAVRRYKEKVRENVGQLRRSLRDLLS